jgi:voltage-gated potassium channel
VVDNPGMPASTRTARSYLLRALGACGLLVVIFYLAPVEPDVGGGQLVVRALLAAAAAVTLALLIGRMVVRVIRNEPEVRLAGLLVALFAGLVLFAFVDFMIAVSTPGQFQELETKTDALYFAVATLATVGFGDVHATGQLARAVVTGQMLFNLAVLATGGTVLVGRITAGRQRPRPAPPESSPSPGQGRSR